MTALTLQSPAKINLLLAITGRRTDGFHELLSVVAPLEWGDTVTVEPSDEFSLVCNDPAVPVDTTNLILKAAYVFRRATGLSVGAKFTLEKRIPMGAGLGGGSSNAATALLALNKLAGSPLALGELASLAAEVGSDCPLFVYGRPLSMRGRGELIEPLPESAAKRVSGRRVLVFKPSFSISTPWAYARLAEKAPASYLSPLEAQEKLMTWMESDAPAECVAYNNMEGPAFSKFPALPAMIERLREQFGLVSRMSGSGSACFAFLQNQSPVDAITATIRTSWGESALVLQTRLQ